MKKIKIKKMETKNLFFAFTLICLPFFSLSENEPNDDVTQANTLGVNASDAGTLSTIDLNDWWKVTIPADGKLIINTTSDATLDLDLLLYDINGTTQIATFDSSSGIHEATHYNSLMPGTYYVNARWWNGFGSYTISSIFIATGLTNDAENNDSVQVAINLPLNGSSSGHLSFYSDGYTDVNDWLKIIIPADGKLIVNTTSDATLDINLLLYDINGTTQIASFDSSSGIHEATHYDNLMPGTYYVNASRWTGYGSYTISSIYTATGLANDSENNDSSQVAIILPLNDSSTGHLYFYTNGYNDLVDWWKVTVVSSGGNLIVNTTSDSTLDIDLYLYDTDGTTQIASYDTIYGIHEATHYNNILPGTYYIKALRWTGYGSYTIESVFYFPEGITNALMIPNEVLVFPNPTFDKVTVSSLEKINTIEIYNVLGEKINTMNDLKQLPIIIGTKNEIDLSGFTKGIYFIKIYTEQKIQTKKIVIQ